MGTKRNAKNGHEKQEKADGHLTNNGEIIFFCKVEKKTCREG